MDRFVLQHVQGGKEIKCLVDKPPAPPTYLRRLTPNTVNIVTWL